MGNLQQGGPPDVNTQRARDILRTINPDEASAIDLRNRGLTQLPDDLWDFQRAVSLNLNSNRLTDLPADIGYLSALTTLRISQNYLTTLPGELSALYSLTLLDASKNNIATIAPTAFLGLPALKDLQIHSNRIRELPDSFGSCRTLVRLLLYNNRIERIPGLGQLELLEELDAAHNLLQWPDGLGACVNLQTLNLSGNFVEVVGPDVACLKRLRRLDLRLNSLRALPREIGACDQLEEIALRGNQLTSLPDELAQLTRLRILRVERNSLASLPATLGLCVTLVKLDLSRNALTELPAAVGQLSRLNDLDVSGNQLTQLPAEIGAVASLRYLFCMENDLTELPDSIGLIAGLQTLNVAHNKLRRLPDSLSQLHSLSSLDVSANQLTELPPVHTLTALVNLNAAYNCLAALPDSLHTLRKLHFLAVSFNDVRAIPSPSTYFASVPSLQTLHLGYNPLGDDQLGQLQLPRSLTTLRIEGTHITRLPDELFRLTLLKDLAVGSNLGLTAIDGPFADLANLQVLDATCCRLAHVSAELTAATKLTQLNLSNNALASLPQSLGRLQQLTELDVSSNRLERLPASLPSCTCLRKLKCADNYLTSPPHDLWLSPVASLSSPSGSHLSAQINPPTLSLDPSSPSSSSTTTTPPSLPVAPPSGAPSSPRGASSATAAAPSQPAGSSDEAVELPDYLWLSFEGNPCYAVEEKLKKGALKSRLPARTVRTTPIEPVTDVHLLPARPYLPAAQPGDPPQPVHVFADGTKSPLSLKPLSAVPTAVQLLHEPWPVEFGWAEMVGRRPDQEDTFLVLRDFGGSAARHLVCLFDGHGGSRCAEMCATMFPPLFADSLRACTPAQKAKESARSSQLHPLLALKAMKQTFSRLQRLAVQQQLEDGCTAISVLLSFGSVLVASVGDCRAVVFRRDESYAALSWDHKPTNAAEYLRIRRLGGYVSEDQRVNGVLATSRALGDVALQPFVTYEPQLVSYTASPDDFFIVVACDGLWDVLTEQAVYQLAAKCSSSAEAAARLRDCAYAVGSTDNITVIVAALPAVMPDWFAAKKPHATPKRRYAPSEPIPSPDAGPVVDSQRFEPGSFPPQSFGTAPLATAVLASSSQPSFSPHTNTTSSSSSSDGDVLAKAPKTLQQRLKAPFRRKKSPRLRPQPSAELEAEMDLLTLQMKNEVLSRVGEKTKLEWIVQRSNTDVLPNSQDAIVLSGMTAQAIRRYISVISQRSSYPVESFLEVIAPPDDTATPNERLGYLLYSHPEAVDQINEAASQYVSVLSSLISLHYRDDRLDDYP